MVSLVSARRDFFEGIVAAYTAIENANNPGDFEGLDSSELVRQALVPYNFLRMQDPDNSDHLLVCLNELERTFDMEVTAR